MVASPMDPFIRLSSALTGIAADKLAPGVDPINIKQTYFDTAQQAEPAVFKNLIDIVTGKPVLPPEQLADLILNQSGDDIKYFARSIMLAWYLGSWYQPADLRKAATSDPPGGSIGFKVITMNAYTQGWAWSVAQAHPMGFSTNIFGYWSEAPPSLADTIGSGS